MKRIITSAVSLVLCLAFLMIPSLAAMSTSDLKVPDEAVILDILEAKEWKTVNGILQMRNNAEGALIVFPDDDDSVNMSFQYEFEEAIDLSDCHEIGIEVHTTSEDTTCSYTLTVFSEGDSFKSTVTATANETRLIFFELPSKISDSIDSVQLTVSCTEQKPTSCTVYKIFADEGYSYSYIDIFNTISFTAIEGEIETDEDSVKLIANGANSVVLAELSTKGEGEAAAVSFVVQSTHSGVITVEDTELGKTYQTAMYAGENEYTVFVSSVPDNLKLSFSASSATDTASYTLTRMTVNKTNVSDHSKIGSVSSCRYDGSNVTVTGTVTPSAAVEYIDSSIGLFKVNVSSGDADKEPIAKIKMSTSFEVSAAVDSANSQNKYFVAIIDGDANIPLSIPMFASSYSDALVPYSNTTTGLLGVGTADAFTYNAGLVVLDVHINDLLTSDMTASRLFSYGEELYYFKEAYIDELSDDVRFMKALGYNVYLRMYSANAPLNDKYDGETVSKMSAALSFVTNEIDGIDGFAMLSDYDKTGDILERSRRAADVMGIFAGVVRSIRGQTEMFISSASDNTVFATYTAYYAKKVGIEGLSAMFSCSDSSQLTGVKISADASAYPRVMTVYGKETSFKDFYEASKAYGIFAAVLDVSKSDDFKGFAEVSSGITQKREGFEGRTVKPTGTYSLWDFTDAYTTFGWIAGGGLSSPTTVESAGKRAMRCELSGGEEGVVLCRAGNITNLSAADGVVIKFKVNGENGANIDLILATKQSRAVFSGYLENGEATLYADVSKFTATDILEYVAVSVDSAKDVELDVYEVSLYSEELTDEELALKLVSSDEGNAGKYGALIVVICTAFVVTMVVFILLSRKKESDKKADRD